VPHQWADELPPSVLALLPNDQRTELVGAKLMRGGVIGLSHSGAAESYSLRGEAVSGVLALALARSAPTDIIMPSWLTCQSGILGRG
jgi:hypothetical protein